MAHHERREPLYGEFTVRPTKSAQLAFTIFLPVPLS